MTPPLPADPAEPIRRALRPVTRPLRRAGARLAIELDAVRTRSADLALFHDFAPPPAGGGHQSLRAFVVECRRRGIRVENNTVSSVTRACLFNSFNFDARRLGLLSSRVEGLRMVHRVGAVTSLYRGFDDGTDAWVGELNRRFAHRTIAISQATVDMYRQIGIELVSPRVIHNPCDPAIFHPHGRTPFARDRKVRLISTSWSDNPHKGGPTYRWLEDHLDWSRFEFTFVGNAPEPFERVRHVPPLASGELADLLRQHDVFVTATEHDAYSNALVEALSCGLPAVYLASGGSAEAVQEAGLAFREKEEIPALLDRIVGEYERRQAAISLPPLGQVVDAYLEALGLEEFIEDR
jgi:glycosyltransferase involved in cell wall biosynthesis